LDKIIGLGQTGCRIAEQLTEYPEYRVYKIDSEIKERASLSLGVHLGMDDYEKNLDQEEVAIYLRSIKETDGVLLVVEGGTPISGAALGILETIKNARLNVLYVCPDISMLTETQKRDNKIAFGVLQEYARSGMFESIFLVSSNMVDRMLGDVTIDEYHSRFAYFVSYAVAMINYFNHSIPVVANRGETPIGCRILTLGSPLLENEQPPLNLFFPLEEINGIHFYYGIPENEIKDDTALLARIKSHVRFYQQEGVSTSFSVYSTTLSEKVSFCVAYSEKVQSLSSTPG